MANGDAAAAAGMATVLATADRRLGYDEINKSRDYIAAEIAARTAAIATRAAASHSHAAGDISSGTLSTSRIPNLDASKITSGEIANARTTGDTSATPNTLALRNAEGRFNVADPVNSGNPVHKAYCDANGSDEANGPTDSAYARTATGSGWYQVWMNSSNQFMRNTSSLRYKEDVAALDPELLQRVLQLEPSTYHRKGQPEGTREVGLIAERCVDVPGLVTWDVPRNADGKPRKGGKWRPEAVRYEQVLPVYLLAIVQQQQRQIDALERAVEALREAGE